MTREELAALFDSKAPMLQKAMDRAGVDTVTLEDFRNHVLNEDMQLWVTDKYVAVTEVLNYALKRTVMVHLASGDLQALLAANNELDKFARIVGATQVEFEGRQGWARVYKDSGWKLKSIHMIREVDYGR